MEGYFLPGTGRRFPGAALADAARSPSQAGCVMGGKGLRSRRRRRFFLKRSESRETCCGPAARDPGGACSLERSPRSWWSWQKVMCRRRPDHRRVAPTRAGRRATGRSRGRAEARGGGPDPAGRRPDGGGPGSDPGRFRSDELGCGPGGVRCRSGAGRSRSARVGPRPGRGRLGALPCQRGRVGRAGVRGVAYPARRDQSGARVHGDRTVEDDQPAAGRGGPTRRGGPGAGSHRRRPRSHRPGARQGRGRTRQGGRCAGAPGQ